MTIQRIEPADRWSKAVIHNNVIYYTSIPIDLTEDTYIQTKSTLDDIENMLKRLGSDKSQILDATIFLANKADFSEMNRAWDEWVCKGSAPVRCTVEAALMIEAFRVEIKVIAAIK